MSCKTLTDVVNCNPRLHCIIKVTKQKFLVKTNRFKESYQTVLVLSYTHQIIPVLLHWFITDNQWTMKVDKTEIKEILLILCSYRKGDSSIQIPFFFYILFIKFFKLAQHFNTLLTKCIYQKWYMKGGKRGVIWLGFYYCLLIKNLIKFFSLLFSENLIFSNCR